MKKVRMLESRGNPTDGTIIRAGATIELPDFWADKFIADGTAELARGKEKQVGKGKSKT